jgi:beta-phosphoglucomutase-like phosphatase (HAD superfamily)
MTVSAVVGLEKIAEMIFDTDGGITDTARAHAIAWKQVFDVFLGEHAKRSGADLVVTGLAELRLKGAPGSSPMTASTPRTKA